MSARTAEPRQFAGRIDLCGIDVAVGAQTERQFFFILATRHGGYTEPKLAPAQSSGAASAKPMAPGKRARPFAGAIMYCS